MKIKLIIDCGTTNLRVTVLDEQEKMICCGKYDGGVRHTAIDGHNGRLRQMLKDGIEEQLSVCGASSADVQVCVAYGMITSNVGLLEIPHNVAPSGKNELHAKMRTQLFEDIADFPITFIPGVRNLGEAITTDNFADMDMMRGEETEAIGLWNLLHPGKECIFILPGSHNKFVHMDENGHILGCKTSISGELLDALTHHTILAGSVDHAFVTAEEYDAEMACLGAKESIESGVGRAAFAGRILDQLGKKPKDKIRSYLLGVCLAQDLPALQGFSKGNQVPSLYIAGGMPVRQAMTDIVKKLWDKDVIQVDDETARKMGYTGAALISRGGED